MAYSALAIANALLDIGRENQDGDLTPMKIQKLVYFAYGWYLGVTGVQLLDEPIEAWQYGPVIPGIYNSARVFGNSPIIGYLGNYKFTENSFTLVPELLSAEENQELRPFLVWIWNQYGKYSGIHLSNITHLPGSPWSLVVEDMKKEFGRIMPHWDIPPSIIRDYFSKLWSTLQDSNTESAHS